MNARFPLGRSALVILLAVVSGCMTYGPQQVSRMSTYDICETQVGQGWNLDDESKRALQTELDRRKESCAPHRTAIRAQRDEELYDRMYRNQSP